MAKTYVRKMILNLFLKIKLILISKTQNLKSQRNNRSRSAYATKQVHVNVIKRGSIKSCDKQKVVAV